MSLHRTTFEMNYRGSIVELAHGRLRPGYNRVYSLHSNTAKTPSRRLFIVIIAGAPQNPAHYGYLSHLLPRLVTPSLQLYCHLLHLQT